MNRILQADVILTLTFEQASRLVALIDYVSRFYPNAVPVPEYRAVCDVVLEQAVKQGVPK